MLIKTRPIRLKNEDKVSFNRWLYCIVCPFLLDNIFLSYLFRNTTNYHLQAYQINGVGQIQLERKPVLESWKVVTFYLNTHLIKHYEAMVASLWKVASTCLHFHFVEDTTMNSRGLLDSILFRSKCATWWQHKKTSSVELLVPLFGSIPQSQACLHNSMKDILTFICLQ